MNAIVTALTVSALCGSLVATSATHAASFDPTTNRASADPAPTAAPSPQLVIAAQDKVILIMRQERALLGGAIAHRDSAVGDEALDLDRGAASGPLLRGQWAGCPPVLATCSHVLTGTSPGAFPVGGDEVLDLVAAP